VVKKDKYRSLKIIGAAALFYFLFVRARTAPVEEITESNIKKALKKIYDQYGREKTTKLESLFRNETAHFNSGQFLGTLSPGMEVSPQTNTSFPFGWNSLKSFADQNNIPYTKFFASQNFTEGGTGLQKKFVGFPDLYTSMKFVMYVIEKRNWNFGKWRSFDEQIAADYNAYINRIRTPYTNSFT
jgi:hypothetical protein